MISNSNKKHQHRIIAGCTALLLVLLACNTPGSQPEPDPGLFATQISIQATQTALAVIPPPPADQPPADQPPPDQPPPDQPPVDQPPPDQPPADQLPPQDEAPPDVIFEGASFSFDKSIASDVISEKVPGEIGDGFPGSTFPTHLRFAYNNYALQGTFHEPQMLIYPVEEFRPIDESAAEEINALHDLLAARPADMPDHMPFLPLWNAAQMFSSNVRFVDFQNGAGVRYLSQYGQAFAPINNNSLFYTFQGLTMGDTHYVAALFPVSHPSLPADGNSVPNDDWEAFGEDFENYIRDIEQQLSAQPDNSFTPDLMLLDAMIQSLRVE